MKNKWKFLLVIIMIIISNIIIFNILDKNKEHNNKMELEESLLESSSETKLIISFQKYLVLSLKSIIKNSFYFKENIKFMSYSIYDKNNEIIYHSKKSYDFNQDKNNLFTIKILKKGIYDIYELNNIIYYVYYEPIIKNNNYIGALKISFSENFLLKYLLLNNNIDFLKIKNNKNIKDYSDYKIKDNIFYINNYIVIKNSKNRPKYWIKISKRNFHLEKFYKDNKRYKLISILISILLFLLFLFQIKLNKIKKINEENLIEKAYKDNLTKIYNRNKFDEIFIKELKRVNRYKIKSALVIFDIDFFKKVNDNYGHLIGDEILIMLSNVIKKNIRETDTLARWGGEEFIILLPETSKNDALILCENLRKIIEETKHDIIGNVTGSFGVTEFSEDKYDQLDDILKRCDDALYLAKENGRNCIFFKDKKDT